MKKCFSRKRSLCFEKKRFINSKIQVNQKFILFSVFYSSKTHLSRRCKLIPILNLLIINFQGIETYINIFRALNSNFIFQPNYNLFDCSKDKSRFPTICFFLNLYFCYNLLKMNQFFDSN